MNDINTAIARLVISKNPKLTAVKNFLFKNKLYTDWLGYLQFSLEKLKKDIRLTKEEQEVVTRQRKLINRFKNSKRPSAYLKRRINIFAPLIQLILKYEQ